VVHALAGAGAAEVVVVNRSADAAERAVALAGPIGRVGGPTDVAKGEIVVNATPVGMHGPAVGQLPCPADALHGAQIVVDLVYDPLETALMVEARRRGAQAHNGVSMLVFQAAEAFERWTGHDAPVEAMLTAAGSALQSRAKR
jgi:shikimate dehydrogenase